MSDGNDRDLAGRVLAIAGATGGLGPSVARRFAAAGATLALVDVDGAAVEGLAQDLGVPGNRVDARAVDLLDEIATRDWRDGLVDRFGHVDGLVHLVGGWRGGEPMETAPLADWNLLHDLLVRTVQHTTRAFSHALLDSGRGRFVLVSSVQAQRPEHGSAAYAAAKAAAEAWTLALADGFSRAAAEEAPAGAPRRRATANVVVVDAIATPEMVEGKDDDAFASFADADDIAALIATIVGDAASAMNGQRVGLHGGTRR